MREVPARFNLWLMAFFSYALQNILISNISIAMTDMVELRPSNGSQLNVSSAPTGDNGSQPIISKAHSAETFSWDEAKQGMVIGAPYWLLPIGNVASALISHSLSPKLVIGYSIFLSSALNLATPIAANVSFPLLITVRVVLGFIIGLAFPSVLTIVPYWIPLSERGRFVSCIVGYNFGSAVVNFLGGFLIDFVNWKAVFYVPGIMGLIWCLVWKYLMYDRPDQHPRISENERELLSSMNATLRVGTKRNRKPIPWKDILLSAHVWINIFCQFGCVWTWLTITSYGPLFLKTIHNLSIGMISVFIGSPFVARAVMGLVYSALTDRLIKNKVMSVTNARKLSIILSNILPSIFLVIQILYEENTYVTVAAIALIIMCSGMNVNGGVAGLIDISPNFGGSIQGIGGAVTLAGGFMIPIAVGHLTLNNNTIEQWRKFFIITSGLCFSSGMLFVLTWDSRVKEWNSEPGQELKSLKPGENGTKPHKGDNVGRTPRRLPQSVNTI